MMVKSCYEVIQIARETKSAGNAYFLLVIGLGLIFASLIIALRSYTQYAAQPKIIPYQTEIEGIPLGGLSLEEASQRIQEAFDIPPIELQYKNARMQFSPAELGFQLDTAAILEQIPQTTRPISFKTWFFLGQAKLRKPLISS